MLYLRQTPPAALPVSLGTLKAHLRREADETEEDALLTAYLEAAVAHLDGREGTLGRCLVDQTWTAIADRPERLPCGRSGFRLGLGPIRAPQSIAVRRLVGGQPVDVDAALWRVAPERLEEASIVLAVGAAWPAADPVPGAWRIDFTAGFGGPADVPEALRAAILLLAADLDGDRSGKTLSNLVVNPTIERLVAPYRKVCL